MSIQYKDFVPQLLNPPRYLKKAEFQTFREALAGLNEWLDRESVEVVQIETVVLPNIHHPHEEGSDDVDLRQDDDFVYTRWHQFIRVWYRPK